jgi:hypothetical protein
MSTLEPATAEVETWPDGSVGVLVTIPAAKGPVYLDLAVSRHAETGTWQADLPLWPREKDLRKIRDDGVLSCYTNRKEVEFGVEPDVTDPEACDSWEVDSWGTAYLTS